jgi:hypothetical protein
MLRSSPAIDVSQQQPDIAHGSNWCKRRPTLWSDAAVCGPEEGVSFRDIVVGRRPSKPLTIRLPTSARSTTRRQARSRVSGWDGAPWSPRSFPISTGRAILKVDESA